MPRRAGAWGLGPQPGVDRPDPRSVRTHLPGGSPPGEVRPAFVRTYTRRELLLSTTVAPLGGTGVTQRELLTTAWGIPHNVNEFEKLNRSDSDFWGVMFMLEALGLSGASELVYLTLLECPGVDFQYLTGCLNLTEPEVHEALDELTQMALLHTCDSWQRTPKLVDPEIGLAALVARQQAEVARRQREIEDGRLAFATLLSKIAESHSKPAEPGTVRLEGIEAIRRRLRDLAASSELEVCSFIPGGAQSAASLQANRALDADVIDRGVRLRTIYLDSARNDGPTLDYAHWFCDLGGEVRTVPTLPLRMFIVDRRVAIVPENLDDGDAVAIVVSNGGLVVALYTLFASVWRPRHRFARAGLATRRALLTRDERCSSYWGMDAPTSWSLAG